jgi:FkbM family methyltransferase
VKILHFQEQHTIDLIKALVRPGDVCADIGANCGDMTDAMLIAGAEKVYAFDILSENVAILAKRFIYPHVIVEKKAVSSGPGTVPVRRSKTTFEATILDRDVRGTALEVSEYVTSVSIDQYFSKSNLEFIKIDVEGAENLVLQGMSRTLSVQRPLIFIEFHNDAGWGGRDIIFENDYKLLAVYHMGTILKKWIEPEADRHYHCLAVPKEQVSYVTNDYINIKGDNS